MELLPGSAPGLHRYQRCVLLLSLQERKRDGTRTRKLLAENQVRLPIPLRAHNIKHSLSWCFLVPVTGVEPAWTLLASASLKGW